MGAKGLNYGLQACKASTLSTGLSPYLLNRFHSYLRYDIHLFQSVSVEVNSNIKSLLKNFCKFKANV